MLKISLLILLEKLKEQLRGKIRKWGSLVQSYPTPGPIIPLKERTICVYKNRLDKKLLSS